ncbi:hypothetical protein OXL99_23735, partial [Pseudomonas fulva]
KMLYSAAHLYYNFGVVRRRGAHYTDAPKGCKALDQKKSQKIQLVDFMGLLPIAERSSGGCPRLTFPVSIRLCQNSYLYTPR